MESLKGIRIKGMPLRPDKKVGTIFFEEMDTTVLYQSDNGSLIIKEWVDCSDDGNSDRYFYYETEKIFLARFLKRDLSHFELIINAVNNFVYFEDTDPNNGDYIIYATNNIPDNYLPSAGFVHQEKDIVNYDIIAEAISLDNIPTAEINISELQELSKEKKAEIYNLHIKAGENVGFGSIVTKVLGKTLLKFEGFYENIALDVIAGKDRVFAESKSLSNKKNLELVKSEYIGHKAASFGILIKPFKSETSLFDEGTSGERIANRAFGLLQNSVTADLLKSEYSNHSKFTISAYKKLLKEIYSQEIDIDFLFNSYYRNNQYKQGISHTLANTIIEYINELNTIDEDNFSITGKFRSINCDTLHFNFTSADEIQINGYFDKKIKEGIEQILFTQIYEISIERKIIEDASKDVPDTKDTIVAFYKKEI